MTDHELPDNPYHEQDARVGIPKKIFDVRLIIRIVQSLLRRRWLAIGISIVIAGSVGFVASKPLTKEVWKTTAMLLYTPPTVPEEVKSLEASFALTNIAGFATCRPVLNQIKENLGLPFPTALMANSIKAETSRNSATIFMSITWGDQTEANQIMEQLTTVFPDHVAKVRQSISGALLQETESQIGTVKARQDAARTRFRDFTREHKIIDFKQDLILLQTKLLDLESRHGRARRDEESMLENVKLLEDHIADIRRVEEEETEANKEFEAAEESLADNRRRQNRLRELIADERRLLDMQAQIEVKRREYERAKVLAEKQLISNSQFEVVRGELESMIAKITESDSIQRWKKELLDLDELVVPKNRTSKKGSPIIQQILFKKLETELNIAQARKRQLEIDREVSTTRTQIATFQKLRNELATLEDDITSISNEREKLESRAAVLRQLASMGPTEFSVVSPVATGEFPVSTNRKKMFIGIMLGMLLLTGTTIIGFDALLTGIVPTDINVEIMGLPILARFKRGRHNREVLTGNPNEYGDEVRLLALQLRQRLSEPGSVSMFTEISVSESYSVLIQQLSHCLAGRDERVCVVDTRETQDGLGEFVDLVDPKLIVEQVAHAETLDDVLPGLRDWLGFRCLEIDDVALPTTIPGVDCILPGLSMDKEELVTLRMDSLIDELRERYTMVIVLSPSIDRVTELQVLAAYANTITFVFTSDALNSASKSAVRQLAAIQAPMIGAVQV